MTSKLSLDDRIKMQEVMFKRTNIRNMSVIAHVDHGKSTLTDALVCKAGLIPETQSGEKRWADNREDEIERGITIKSTAVSLYFEMQDELIQDLPRDGNGFLVNLIDSPGHVDFSSEVTAALRVTDGALVVVDVISGVSVQTETVLRQALSERIKPVLIINKIDRAILEQKLEPEKLYQRLKQIVDQVNYLIDVYSDEQFRFEQLDPVLGNVSFSAGKDGWAFTLTQFASMLSKKNKSSSSSMVKKLWNENYFNTETGKWQQTDESADRNKLKRGFNQFILEPIYKVLNSCLENNYDELEKLRMKLELADFKVKPGELMGKELMKAFMKKWLPAADAMLELIILHLPSPLVAQRYRVKGLYEGPLDDESAIAIRECDSSGPLMIFISKMIPDSSDKNKFLAFGRVFSGTAESGQRVRIITPNNNLDDSNKLRINLTSCVCMIGDKAVSFDQVPCGNMIALSGIEKYILKSGTIASCEKAFGIKCMKFYCSPVVRCAVDPVNPTDLPKVIEGL
jgi:elongation factor 2